MVAIGFALFLALLPILIAAQSPVYGQCGGIGYTGPTTCAAGSTCTVSNAYYSQCLPGSSAPSSTAAPSTTSKPPTSTTSVPSSTATGSIQLTGRVPTSGANAGLLTWPNIGIHFTFSGTTASVTFTNQVGSSGFTISVDGSTPVKTTSQSGTTLTLSTGTLAKGTHTVQIFRVSEAAEGSIVFAGASAITTDGTLLTSSPSTRRIEFIGDSITAGYGADGILPCTESVLTENAGKTYAADIGAFFKADISVVAWSGKGVIRNYPTGSVDTSPIIPQLWQDVAASYSVTEAYTFPAALAPQAVVLNIGTNDFAYLNYRDPITQSQYSTGIVNFVKTIRSKYPSAKIFMVSSVMLSDGYPAGQNQHSTQLAGLQDAKTALNDPNVFVTDLPAQGSDVGCDYHPLPAEHAQMAAILEPVMKSALGW